MKNIIAWVKIILLISVILYAKAYADSEQTNCVTIVSFPPSNYYSHSKIVATSLGNFNCNNELLLMDYSAIRRYQMLVIGKRYNVKTIGVFSKNIIDVKAVE
jgi:hypothetical protein